MTKLNFDEFRKANLARKKQFFKDSTTDDWSISDCFMAAVGELGEISEAVVMMAALRHLGEAGNALKKVRRAQLGMLNKNEAGRQIDSLDDAKAKVAGEIGGFMCYLDQLAEMIGLRLDDCIADEFNKKSAELGLPERIVDGKFAIATRGMFTMHGIEYEDEGEIYSVPVDEPIHMELNDAGALHIAQAFGEQVQETKYRQAVPPRIEPEYPMAAQRAEFDALDKLIQAVKNLPPVVDDDYPHYRGRYESAMMNFLRAIKKNGRTLPPWN